MNLGDLFTLARAGRYTNPQNSNDRLPIVYGDLTDGTSGNWILPCIDTTTFVYCFAAHAVLSVANGNSINIYADDALVDPGDYTFDESDNYQSEGVIATVTFTADQENKVISARGMGKASGSTLIENIVDIIYDFLTVENDLTAADFDSAAKAKADSIYETQGYKAAGVIDQDVKPWDLLTKMMSSFLGSIYFNAQKKLIMQIDDGNYIGPHAAIMSKADITLVNAIQRIESIINQCSANYAYNYKTGEFRSHDSGTGSINTNSQAIYGVREPDTPYQFYWCRHEASINTMQAIITGSYGSPVYELSFFDESMKRAHLDVGDLAVATFEALYDLEGNQLINQLVKILTVSPDFDNDRVEFTGMDAGFWLSVAYLADGTYDADGSIKAGGDRDTTIY